MFSNKSPTYSLSLYPNEDFFEVYSTNNSFIATVGSVCIIICTSLLFLLYDFFVWKEFRNQRAIMEARRTFMRFVSHEVRRFDRCGCLEIKFGGLSLLRTVRCALL